LAKAPGSVNIIASQAGNLIYDAAQASSLLLVVDNSTGLDDVNASQAITVYPNPASKSAPVYVSANVEESVLANAMITVYTENGSLVKNVQVTGKLTKVDLPADSGIYLLVIKGKENIIKTLRIIVK